MPLPLLFRKDGVTRYYEAEGSGRPVVVAFLHWTDFCGENVCDKSSTRTRLHVLYLSDTQTLTTDHYTML